MITINTSKFDLVKAKGWIDKFVAKRVSIISSGVYNDVISNTKPRWSGQYLASWSISVGAPEYIQLETPKRIGANGYPSIHYTKNGQQIALVPVDNPYQKVYITNAAPHAMMVEYDGTPTHPNDGWMIANHSLNEAIASFKFF